jgi:hypothetical protein
MNLPVFILPNDTRRWIRIKRAEVVRVFITPPTVADNLIKAAIERPMLKSLVRPTLSAVRKKNYLAESASVMQNKAQSVRR